MKGKRKKYDSRFKVSVAIAAIQERESLSELSARFGVHPTMISNWKKEFLERSQDVFSTGAPSSSKDVELEKEKEELYAKIGKLEMECDWLKKKSKQLGL